MKIILVACLVVSAFAAPAEKIKRDILPGDPRYDAKHHQHHSEFDHHENEVEITKALGGFAGSFSIPEFRYSGFENGDFLGGTDLLNYNFDASEVAVDSDAIKIGGNKAFERLESVTESSLPKVESVTVIKSGDTAEADKTTSTNFGDKESEGKVEDADKEPSKDADETKVESTSDSDSNTTPSDFIKTTVQPVTIEAKSSAKGISSEIGLPVTGLATPSFDSSFDSGYTSFGQSAFNPSFRSAVGYSPGFDGFNRNYEYYNNYGGQPLNLGAYNSGFENVFRGQTFDANIPVEFSQFSSVDFTKNVPYLTPSSFPSIASVSKPITSDFKFNSKQTYLSPAIGQTKPQFGSTLGSQDQQQLFKNYNPFPLAQPTPASFQAAIQPEFKIAQGSYSGVSQLTDANGGYVY